MLEADELTSSRFSIKAARLVDLDVATTAIDDAACAGEFEFAVARVDASALAAVHRLERAGFRLMDTLVYFSRLIPGTPAVANEGGASIRLATSEDIESVSSIARNAFAVYIGHFHTDERLDNDLATDTYVDWAQNLVANVDESNPVLIAAEGEEVIGFLAMSDVGSGVAEIRLNAVHPDQQGRGVYAALLSRAITFVAEAGDAELVVSTQLDNYRVQRSWVRAGFMPQRSLYTFHKWFDALDKSL